MGQDLRGADVIVLAGEGDPAAIARSAPAAVVLVMDGDALAERCRQVYEATLFPRARILGIEDAARVGAAVESIVFEQDDEHDAVVMNDGEFGPRRVRLGRGGIRELL